MTITVLLVDDHAVVRSGLSKFLMVNKDLKLVGEASDGAEAVQMVSLHRPDVFLMDLMMPGTDGITGTREVHQKYPKVKVIALTSFAEQNMIQGALQAGAVGYLQKNVTAAELGLIDVIRDQVTFDLQDVAGTIVGFRIPGYLEGVNVPGYHMHFLTADRKAGGHVLAFRAERLRAAADVCTAVHVALPRDRRFSAKDSTGVDRKEMDQILGRVPLGEAPPPK